MSDSRVNPLGTFLALFGLLVLAFAGLGYGLGWIQFDSQGDQTTIEIDKGEAERDTREAVDRTREAMQDAGRAIDEAVSDTGDVVDAVGDAEQENAAEGR